MRNEYITNIENYVNLENNKLNIVIISLTLLIESINKNFDLEFDLFPFFSK